MAKECPFWEEDGSCMNRACGVETKDEVRGFSLPITGNFASDLGGTEVTDLWKHKPVDRNILRKHGGHTRSEN